MLTALEVARSLHRFVKTRKSIIQEPMWVIGRANAGFTVKTKDGRTLKISVVEISD